MRQAIVTKYHGTTSTRCCRISARSFAGRVYVPYDHALDLEENHAEAARAMVAKFEWYGVWIAGANPDQTGNTYCMREFKNDVDRHRYRKQKLIVIQS